jgi:hypothetical protein
MADTLEDRPARASPPNNKPHLPDGIVFRSLKAVQNSLIGNVDSVVLPLRKLRPKTLIHRAVMEGGWDF